MIQPFHLIIHLQAEATVRRTGPVEFRSYANLFASGLLNASKGRTVGTFYRF